MKDNGSTPTPGAGSSLNEFERDKPGTNARTSAEAEIERMRKGGGVFVNAIRATRMPMVLTDPNLPGNPIVFANQAFLGLSGYSMEEVLGQQPYFMNGSGTDPRDAARFKEALRAEQDDIIETIQYRKDGSRFVATVLLSAFKDDSGNILNHFMSWLDVTRRVAAEEEVSELRKTQEALRASEAKYRLLFDSVDEGFCIVEVLFDEDGKAVDYVFQEINPALERQTGIVDAIGKGMRSLAPDHEEHWFERYGRIVRTGVPERFEDVAAALGRWYDVFAFRVGPTDERRVAILFRDVLTRKRSELALQENQERQAFLLRLSDTLQPLSDASEIQATTARMLGEHLGVDRAMYAEVEGDRGSETGTIRGQYVRPADGEAPAAIAFPNHFTFEPFGAHTMARRYRGDLLVVSDIGAAPDFSEEERAAWAAADVRAAVVAPLAKNGRLVAEFGVHSTMPREWKETETSLIREVAERTWAAAERARAEAALRQSERRRDSALLAASMGTWDYDLVADVCHFDARAQEMYNLPSDQLDHRRTGVALVVHPDDVEPMFAEINKASDVNGDGRYDIVYRIAQADGTYRWLRACGITEFEGDGEARRAIRIVGASRDITIEREAEAALREGERLRTAMLDVLPLGLALTDKDGNSILTNSEWARFIPTNRIPSRDNERGARWRSWDENGNEVSPENFPGARALRGERVHPPMEFLFRDDGGRDVWTSVGAVPFLDADDNIAGAVCFIENIDEVKRGREALRDSEEQLRLIVDSALDYAIFTTDPENRITSWLPGAQNVFGWTSEEAIGQLVDITFTPEDRAKDAPRSEIEEARRTGTAPNVRWHVRKDGRRVFIEGHVIALHNDKGEVDAFLKIGQDVTDKHRASEMQSTLLAELQHRVRNILAMIQSVVQRTLHTSTTAEEYARHLAGRISAMARTQVLLTRSEDAHINLEDMIRDELLGVAATEDQFWCEGPEVALAAKAAEILTLAVHELATNSVKFGALSNSGGQIEIRWNVEVREGQQWLIFEWEEARGSDANLDREGFGTELITRRVPYELQGKGRLEPSPGGLTATIEFPLLRRGSILETKAPEGPK